MSFGVPFMSPASRINQHTKVSIVSIIISGNKSVSVVEIRKLVPRVDTDNLLLLLNPLKSEVHLNATNTSSPSPTPNPQP